MEADRLDERELQRPAYKSYYKVGNKIKKLYLLLIGIFCLGISSCTPGVFFDLENASGIVFEVRYKINQDFLIDTTANQEQQVRILPGQRIPLVFSWQKLLNHGYTYKKDYIDITVFQAVFEYLEVVFPETDRVVNKKDLKQEFIKYEQPAPTSVLFVLAIN
ncbi:MAG: hypothetical protein JW969_12750 [Spirochaetales bacterium]|nr:hypothetical protein [Spirochaetales bacterium]